MADAMGLAIGVMTAAIPYAVAFGVCRLVVKVFLGAGLGGRIRF